MVYWYQLYMLSFGMDIMKKLLFIFVLLSFNCCSLDTYETYQNYQAQQALNNGKYGQAKEIIDELLVDYPDDPQLNFNAGIIALQNNDPKNAVRSLTHATKNSELQENAYVNLGTAYVRDNQLQEALESYEQALKINPKNLQAEQNAKKIKEYLEQQQQNDNQEKQNRSQEKQKDSQGNALCPRQDACRFFRRCR